MIHSEFLHTINTGSYTEAKKMIAALSIQELTQFLIDLAIDTESIALYTFVCFLLLEEESADLHYCAAGLLTNIFCTINGAYSAALCHARRAAEMLPHDLSCKVELLQYFGLPDHVMEKAEAKMLAHEILAIDSTNITALNTLKIIEKSNIQ
jgi:hypothetical protein